MQRKLNCFRREDERKTLSKVTNHKFSISKVEVKELHRRRSKYLYTMIVFIKNEKKTKAKIDFQHINKNNEKKKTMKIMRRFEPAMYVNF